MPTSTTLTNATRWRILIITSGPLCQNPRPLKEALTLAAAGYQVTVLTVFQNATCAEMDQRLLSGTSVLQETLLPPGSALCQFWQRARTWLTRKLTSHLQWSSPRALGPTGPLLRRARGIPADLTIVHNEAPFWVGVQLMKSGRKVAADFEDWYSEDLLPSARKSRPLRLIRNLERQLLHEAVYCTTTSRSLATALARSYQSRIPEILPNCFTLQPTPEPRPSRAPELVWFSQTIGPGRGLEEFITCWGQLPSTCGRVTLIGSLMGEFDHTLRQLAPAGARDRILFKRPVHPRDLPLELTRFDAGLALEHRVPASRDLTITNKLFQYLNAGLAIIASPTAGQLEVMNQIPQAGVIIDFDLPKARAALEQFLTEPNRIPGAQIAARQAAETHFQWEKISPLLINLVNQATRHPSS